MSHDHQPRHHPMRGIGTNPDRTPRLEGAVVVAPGNDPLARPAGLTAMPFGGEPEESPEPAAAAGNSNGWDILMNPTDEGTANP